MIQLLRYIVSSLCEYRQQENKVVEKLGGWVGSKVRFDFDLQLLQILPFYQSSRQRGPSTPSQHRY